MNLFNKAGMLHMQELEVRDIQWHAQYNNRSLKHVLLYTITSGNIQWFQ